jgi:ferric-dicitrate binding protein FerR (iron transport regulator)
MDRIEELTWRLADGSLTSADEGELAALVAGNAADTDRHLAILRLEAALRGLTPAPDVAAAALDEARSQLEQDLERSVMRSIGQLPEPAWRKRRLSRRWLVASLAAVLLLALGIGWWWIRPDADPHLPRLVSATAEVELHDHDGRTMPATANRPLAPDQTIVTHDDDRAVIAYPDATQVALFGSSRLLIGRSPAGSKRLELRSGGMHLDVQPQPAGRPLIVATPAGEVQVLGTRFRLATGQERTRIEMEEGKVAFVNRADGRRVEVSQGAYVVAADDPAPLTVQPLPPTLSAPLWSRAKTGHALAVSSNGRLAVGGRHGGLLLLDARTGGILSDWSNTKGARGPLPEAAILASDDPGGTFFSVSTRGELQRWNAASGQAEALALEGEVGPLRALSADGRWLAVSVGGGWQKEMRLWRLDAGDLPVLVRDWAAKNDLWSAALAPRGKLAAFGTRIGKLHLQEVESGTERWQRQAGRAAITRAAISPDEQWLAIYSRELGIQVCSAVTGEPAVSWIPEGPAARWLAFSPDGGTLAAALGDDTVRLWSIAERRPTLIVQVGRHGVKQIAFTPDGRLVTAGNDVAVWEVR